MKRLIPGHRPVRYTRTIEGGVDVTFYANSFYRDMHFRIMWFDGERFYNLARKGLDDFEEDMIHTPDQFTSWYLTHLEHIWPELDFNAGVLKIRLVYPEYKLMQETIDAAR